MTAALNPFPDYAVTRLSPGQGSAGTVITPAIKKGRELVDEYLKGLWTDVTSTQVTATGTKAALCAVRGDYGTGKTHLLNDVAVYLGRQCGERTEPSIVRTTCIEADALFWYRASVAPQLDKLSLDPIALQLFGQAGKTVASATLLTESAVEVLEKNPARIRDLIRANQLSVDEVNREYLKQLDELLKDYDPTVRRVLARLVSSETEAAAREWIRGGTLTDHKAELLGVPKAIESAEQAASVIGAIAAMHRAVGRPFLVLVDEFEHFVRYDTANRSSANATWLKRLLEQLGNASALALVAGHWSAWQTSKDYLDRFPQYAPIDLVKLETADVIKIFSDRLGTSVQLDEAQADVIVSVTGGNMRRVMSLCNLLYRQSDGFATRLTESQIHQAWTSVAQRISREQALEQVSDLLFARGFVVKTTDATFRGIPFDLVAERVDGQVILAQAIHAVTPTDHYDAARKFIDKLRNVQNAAPRVIGMFLANGSIDDELLGALRNSGLSNLRWFDLTDRDAMDKIRAEFTVLDGQPASNGQIASNAQPVTIHMNVASNPALQPVTAPAVDSAIAAESEKFRALNAELERKLREFEERRNQEARALQDRRERLAYGARSARDNTVLLETHIRPEREHASYEAMLEEPSLNKKLRYLGPSLTLGLVLIGLGLGLTLGYERIGILVRLNYTGAWFVMLTGIFSCIFGAWVVWRRYSQVVDYFEFARQTIRDLYVRDVSVSALGVVNRILRQSISRYGARRARREAFERLYSLDDGRLPVAVQAYLDEIRH